MAHARVSERNFLRRYAAFLVHAMESDAQSGWGEAESWASLVDAERRCWAVEAEWREAGNETK